MGVNMVQNHIRFHNFFCKVWLTATVAKGKIHLAMSYCTERCHQRIRLHQGCGKVYPGYPGILQIKDMT